MRRLPAPQSRSIDRRSRPGSAPTIWRASTSSSRRRGSRIPEHHRVNGPREQQPDDAARRHRCRPRGGRWRRSRTGGGRRGGTPRAQGRRCWKSPKSSAARRRCRSVPSWRRVRRRRSVPALKDSPQAHAEDLDRIRTAMGVDDDAELRQVLTENVADTVAFLRNVGIEFSRTVAAAAAQASRLHQVMPTSPAYIFQLGRHCPPPRRYVRLAAPPPSC